METLCGVEGVTSSVLKVPPLRSVVLLQVVSYFSGFCYALRLPHLKPSRPQLLLLLLGCPVRGAERVPPSALVQRRTSATKLLCCIHLIGGSLKTTDRGVLVSTSPPHPSSVLTHPLARTLTTRTPRSEPQPEPQQTATQPPPETQRNPKRNERWASWVPPCSASCSYGTRLGPWQPKGSGWSWASPSPCPPSRQVRRGVGMVWFVPIVFLRSSSLPPPCPRGLAWSYTRTRVWFGCVCAAAASLHDMLTTKPRV